MNKKKKVFIVIAIIIALGAAFYGGMTYKSLTGSQKAQGAIAGTLPTGVTMPTGIPTGAMPTGVRPGGSSSSDQNIRGTVLSLDEGSVVVQLTDNQGSKIIMLSENSQILETKAVETDALAVGKSVMIMGTKNDDGTVTANNIMLREAGAEPVIGSATPPAQESASESAQ